MNWPHQERNFLRRTFKRPHEPKYPFPLKHPRYHPPKEAVMTIAAGFVHRDGVLLCSDLLMQDDYSKELGFKILDLEGKWGTGLAAFAGNVDYAMSAIQRFDRKLKNKPSSKVVEALEEQLYEHYTKHILGHSKCGEGDGPDYDLLFAIRPNNDKAH